MCYNNGMHTRNQKQRQAYSRRLAKAKPSDLPIPEMMLTKYDFRNELLKLYQHRQWYQWCLGTAWFNRQAERLIQDWTMSGDFNCDNDWEQDRVIWEVSCEELKPYLPDLC